MPNSGMSNSKTAEQPNRTNSPIAQQPPDAGRLLRLRYFIRFARFVRFTLPSMASPSILHPPSRPPVSFSPPARHSPAAPPPAPAGSGTRRQKTGTKPARGRHRTDTGPAQNRHNAKSQKIPAAHIESGFANTYNKKGMLNLLAEVSRLSLFS